jgi:cyclomaltodextrinase
MLDHIASLGVDGVLLTPIFVSETHGYDTVDPYRIDQRLGDDDDFDALVAGAHERGLTVHLDAVLNHVGRRFPRRELLRDDGKVFEGHDILVVLDHDDPAVVDWATDVLRHWLRRGVDGWRLDAAYAIPRPFLRAVRDAVPGVFMFGEVIHGDYAGFVDATGLDSVTQYELHKAIWSSLNDGNVHELAWALKRHIELLDRFAPVTFVGNHDVTRIASQTDDRRDAIDAATVLLTLPGIPTLYYGDELGWRGVKEQRLGGDDAIRPAVPDVMAPADEVEAATLAAHRDLLARRRSNPWLRDARLEIVDLDHEHLVYRSHDDAHELAVEVRNARGDDGGRVRILD